MQMQNQEHTNKKTESSSSVDTVMQMLSKKIIFIPLLILAAALFFKFTPGTSTLSSKQTVPILEPTPTFAIPTSAPQKEKQDTKVDLDLKGPWDCNYKDSTSSAVLQIKDSKAYAQFQTSKKTMQIVLNDDCIYNWQSGNNKGEKTCGMSTYLGMYQLMAQWGGINLSTLLSLVPYAEQSSDISTETITSLIDTCKKQEVPENSFTVPKNVTFIEATAPSGTPAMLPKQ
jgi:hypothetical protein